MTESVLSRLVAEAKSRQLDPAQHVAATLLSLPYNRITPLQREYGAQQIYYHQKLEQSHGETR